MNIFKNKSVIRLYAFITACIIVITLLLSGINVCAADNPQLSGLYDLNDGILYSDDIDGAKPKHMLTNSSQDTTLVSFFTEYMNLGCPITSLYYEQQVYKDTTTYPCYLFVSNGSSAITFAQFPEGSFIVDSQYDSSNSLVYNRSFYIYSPTNITDHVLGVNSSYNNSYYSFSYKGTTTVDGDSFYYAFEVANLSNQSNYILNTNMPIHVNSDSNNSMIDSMDDVSGDINPSNSGGSDSGDATNNMYFKDFNISYSVSGLTSGNVVCYGTLNDYQKEHLDEFALTYSFNFEYYVYNPTVSGYKYNFTKNYSYQQTLSDFYNNSSSKTFTLKDIMQNINTQDIDSEYGNLYQLVSYLSNTGNNEDIEYIWSKAKMKTTVFIVSASNSPSEILNSSDLHSNSFSKAYNFLDGKSSTYSDGITSNNNPFQTSESGSISDQNELNNMPDGVSSSNIPSSQADNGGSGTSVVTGDNNIVINNNPTFTNNGGSGSGGGSSDGGVASTFYNTFNPFKTLFSSLNGDNNVISDDTAESIGANRFISVMSSTFSFIPEGMWTALTTFFIASLSILVVAVVIRVLLDLL